jgi:hypothetical protein
MWCALQMETEARAALDDRLAKLDIEEKKLLQEQKTLDRKLHIS